LKQIEYELSQSWKAAGVVQHGLIREGEIDRMGVDAESQKLLRKMATTRQEMLLFTTNLQSYLLFEVIGNGWETLRQKVENCQTLDELIRAHDDYLMTITTKALLNSGYDQDAEHHQLHQQIVATQELVTVLDVARRFGQCQTHILQRAQTSLERVQRRRIVADQKINRGQWGYDDKDYMKLKDDTTDTAIEDRCHFLTETDTVNQVVALSLEFDTALRRLLEMLNEMINAPCGMEQVTGPGRGRGRREGEDHHDALRFLTFRLDFNDYYAAGRRNITPLVDVVDSK